jgi:nucleotide-binding universal stress UspA family protein
MGHIQNILVPVDGSPCSIAGLTHAVALAEELGARVELLRVGNESAGEAGERDLEMALESARRRLGRRLGLRMEPDGDPLRKILEVASAERSDLIVVGTHGRIGRLHELVGSVAEGLVRSAPCPVLTVRQPDGEEESFSERVHGRAPISEQTRPR